MRFIGTWRDSLRLIATQCYPHGLQNLHVVIHPFVQASYSEWQLKLLPASQSAGVAKTTCSETIPLWRLSVMSHSHDVFPLKWNHNPTMALITIIIIKIKHTTEIPQFVAIVMHLETAQPSHGPVIHERILWDELRLNFVRMSYSSCV